MTRYTDDTDPAPSVGRTPLVTPIGDVRRLDAPQRIATPPASELEPLASLGVPTWTESVRPLTAMHDPARLTRPAPAHVQPIGPVVKQRPEAATVSNVQGSQPTVAAPIGVIADERVRGRGGRRAARRELRRNAVRMSVPPMLWALLVVAALGPLVWVPLAVHLIEARESEAVGSSASATPVTPDAAEYAPVTRPDDEAVEDPVTPAAVTTSTAVVASEVETTSPYAVPSAVTTDTSGDLQDTARARGWQ